ncbi:TetR/AcrR family transcriptional regulator [Glycomyces tritici]|uniref:TetR/AcrR family transcriptional regulator n=1 Tax=Glycomyces tritici TaxID=2665176 RepID=A0ABT7YST0_9ACTN|nr:TetR/AcrR family transcriptional regulator [Glycomyces tritici]MDN3241650.1 TetR/AcrR family transcriptional regulator [Glycomyces tritici]
MGHREDLLEGAKRCLVERGYSRTTARDIVEASHTNLGSIGYHYGTKDKLLLQAMVEMSGELAERMMAVDPGAGDAGARLLAFWEGMIASFRTDPGLWRANLEILVQTLHDPELRSRLADTHERARDGLGRHLTPGAGAAGRAAGSLHFALIMGVMTQHLIDPDRAPSAAEVVDGLRAISGSA